MPEVLPTEEPGCCSVERLSRLSVGSSCIPATVVVCHSLLLREGYVTICDRWLRAECYPSLRHQPCLVHLLFCRLSRTATHLCPLLFFYLIRYDILPWVQGHP